MDRSQIKYFPSVSHVSMPETVPRLTSTEGKTPVNSFSNDDSYFASLVKLSDF